MAYKVVKVQFSQLDSYQAKCYTYAVCRSIRF